MDKFILPNLKAIAAFVAAWVASHQSQAATSIVSFISEQFGIQLPEAVASAAVAFFVAAAVWLLPNKQA